MGNPLRVVILGGAGWNGSKAAQVVVEDGLFSEVVIADARVEEVEKLAAEGVDSPQEILDGLAQRGFPIKNEIIEETTL